MKGRYYRHSNPLNVGKANNPSYGWTSLWTARSVLQAELVRTIGDGADTRVWEDCWIPEDKARPAIPLGPNVDRDLHVHHLIVHETMCWNEPLIRELVAPEDVTKITALSPSRLRRKDGYVWKHTKSGAYTVRSGYELVNKKRREIQAQPVEEPSTTSLKKEIWSLKTTRKIKHFLWQSLSGFVTSASKLYERHCATDKTCTRCGAEDETINHILFECPPARQCWALSDIPNPPGLFPCMALFSNIDHLLWRAKEHGVPKEILEPFPWILWFLWKSRNNFIFNGIDTPPHETLQLATAEAQSWKVAQITPVIAMEIDGDENSEEREEEPTREIGAIRCQVDASWTHKDKTTGLGFVLWEGDQRALVGLRNGLMTASPLHAEAQALSWAMKMIRQKGFRSVQFETDCAQLLKLVQKLEEWPSMVKEVEDIELSSYNFDLFSTLYTPRGKNQIADCLAKAARARCDTFSHVSDDTPVWFSIASIAE
ncbi:uncharacterized protein LOC130508465 [Raphanus sativus]|uniref:Uncharacterized protein LOC130508465 n=1 Tax=Raphanus sativus TaxID=3726 RepID=A0A9W3D7X5_RAPSA|nr:uncharacterized protein LOC130508465 [Raphanus sativus]